MVSRYAEFIIRWRWLVIIASLIWVGFAASGGRFLSFTTDYRAFFASDNPQLQAFEELQGTYDKSDNVLFLISPKDENVFTAKTLQSIQWLTQEAWQIPYSIRVDSITNYQHTEVQNDDLSVADLVQKTELLDASDLLKIKDIAINEPLLINRIINSEASVTGINVTIQLPGKSLTEVPEVVAFARHLAEQLEQQNSNLELRISGVIMMNNAFGESSQKDMQSLIPLMFFVVSVMLMLLLRSFSSGLTTVIMIMMSITVGMGIFGWLGFKLTPMSASAPTIILTMAVADAVHLLVTILHGMRHGLSKNKAIVESLRVNMQPVFLTTVTTSIGFLSMNFSEVPPLVHLGNIVMMGVVAAFILSVSFLPAMISILPVQVSKKTGVQSRLMNALGNLVISKHKPLLWGMLAISLIFISFIPKNQINDEFIKYFDTRVAFRVDSDYASEKLIGPYTIEYSLGTNEEGGINEPEYLKTVQEFVDYANSQSEVTHVLSLTDTIKRLNKNLHADNPVWYRLPEERDMTAQYLLLYEMSLPYGLDLNNQIDVGKTATRITVSMVNMSSKEVLDLEDRFAQWLQTHAPTISVAAASTNLMFAHIGQRNASSLVFGSAIALVMISLILIVALRSIKIGLISLIPNLVPAGIAFGIWGLMVGNIGMSVSTVVGLTFGIVVDDTVHFLSKFLRARRERNLSTEGAIRYAFDSVGIALIVTTMVLVSGFMILTLSTFRMNSDMGLLTAITIAIALIVDFLLLPSLLIKLKGNENDVSTDDETQPMAAA